MEKPIAETLRERATPEKAPPLGRWGQLFLASLKKNDPDQYRELKASGDLATVAKDVDETASAEYEGLLQKLLQENPDTTTYGDRIAHRTRLERQAAEVVQQNVIVPNPEWARQQAEGYTDENTATWSEEPLLPKPTT